MNVGKYLRGEDCHVGTARTMPSKKPTEVDSMNALRVKAERRVAELKEALQDVLAWLDATPEGYGTVPPDSIERARAALAIRSQR